MILMVLAAAAAVDFDAVAAAPESHSVLIDDARVRVLRVVVEPGKTEPVHEHRWPSVMYFEQPQPITYIEYALVDGVPTVTHRTELPAMPAGRAVRAAPEGLHAILNRGTAPFIALRVEFKDGNYPPPGEAE